MTTITTHQTIGLYSITYTVTTEAGQQLGTYTQQHGADVVTSEQLPAEDSGVIGPIEAIASLAHRAGIRGFKINDGGEVTHSADLVAEIQRRVEAVGGIKGVYLDHISKWGKELGVSTVAVVSVINEQREGVAA